ncbi:MAG: RICIN domain-containing protein [Sulfurovum sp.]|nr:RICIN domain-containing protein [Sulfurovum sp.]
MRYIIFLGIMLTSFVMGVEGSDSCTIVHNELTYHCVKNSQTGRVWLDRNIGASRVAQSNLDNLAKGDNYTTDNALVCPKGFRLPTQREFGNEINSWSSREARDAFNSDLKFYGPAVYHFMDPREYWVGRISISGIDDNPEISIKYGKVRCIKCNKSVPPCDENFKITFPFWNSKEYGCVVNPETGRAWLDRNIGAEAVAAFADDSAAYGDYFQWGRRMHVKLPDTTEEPIEYILERGPFSFVTQHIDWLASGIDDSGSYRSNVISKSNGSGICPYGFRVPTKEEWEAEVASWRRRLPYEQFSSPLKLPTAAKGLEWNIRESVSWVGVVGTYMTSTPANRRGYAYTMTFEDDYQRATVELARMTQGQSVRCIRDEMSTEQIDEMSTEKIDKTQDSTNIEPQISTHAFGGGCITNVGGYAKRQTCNASSEQQRLDYSTNQLNNPFINKCLTAQSYNNGSKITYTQCQPNTAPQIFSYNSTTKQFVHTASHKCLDVHGGNRTDLILWRCHGGINQKFYILQSNISSSTPPDSASRGSGNIGPADRDYNIGR